MLTNPQAHITELCNNTIGYLVSEFNINEIPLPIISHTFTLWRKLAYTQLLKHPHYKAYQQQCLEYFSRQCEQVHLENFLKLIKEQNSRSQIALKKVLAENTIQSQQIRQLDNEVHMEILLEYGQIVWLQELYTELFMDIVNIPYLSELYPKTNNYKLRPQYEAINTNVLNSSNPLVEKIEKNVLHKGLHLVTEKAINWKFLMQVNTVIGVFNPLLMLAGFGINKSLTVYENRQKEMASLECLKLSIQTAKEKVKHLEEAYLLCKAAIAKYVSLCVHSDRKKHGKEIQKIVGEFVTKDWLKIEENVQGEWNVVKLTEEAPFNVCGSYYEEI